MSQSYYQTRLDEVNAAIASIETGAAEVTFADGRRVRRADLQAMYAERARLEAALDRASRTGGTIGISRGAGA